MQKRKDSPAEPDLSFLLLRAVTVTGSVLLMIADVCEHPIFLFGKCEHHGANRRLMHFTGYYNIAPEVARGFLREADGTITTFNVAGAIWTQPEGINAAGDITGFYDEQAGAAVQGFLRYADGRTITFAGNPAIYLGSLPVTINDFDEIAATLRSRMQDGCRGL